MMKNADRNDRGQMALEMILILTILTGVTLFVSQQFKSSEFFAEIISKPWTSISGMIENGSWDAPEKSRHQHPSNFENHLSVEGEVE